MNSDNFAFVSERKSLPATISAGALTLCEGIFYKTKNNFWILEFWIATTSGNPAVAIPDVVFADTTAMAWPVAWFFDDWATVHCMACATKNSNTIVTSQMTSSSGTHSIHGRILLASRPTAYLPEGV